MIQIAQPTTVDPIKMRSVTTAQTAMIQPDILSPISQKAARR
jgi:hypothetical protein